MSVEIKNRYNGEVVATGDTLLKAVTGNLVNLWGADLRGADLSGADLRGANLSGANFWGADLRGADLRGANFWGADLRGANFWGADLRGANLSGANLRDANLRNANLWVANLRNANLWGAKGIWQSHDILAEILRRSAGDDTEKLKVAGLVLVQRDWCWQQMLVAAARDPLGGWAIDELRKWIVEGDDSVPQQLLQESETTKS